MIDHGSSIDRGKAEFEAVDPPSIRELVENISEFAASTDSTLLPLRFVRSKFTGKARLSSSIVDKFSARRNGGRDDGILQRYVKARTVMHIAANTGKMRHIPCIVGNTRWHLLGEEAAIDEIVMAPDIFSSLLIRQAGESILTDDLTHAEVRVLAPIPTVSGGWAAYKGWVACLDEPHQSSDILYALWDWTEVSRQWCIQNPETVKLIQNRRGR